MKNKGIIVECKEQEKGREFTCVDIGFLENDILSCEEKLVFIVLQSFLDDPDKTEGTVSVPMETIARCAGMSTNRAKRTIDKLIEHGFVIRQRPGTATMNIYTIIDRTKGSAE